MFSRLLYVISAGLIILSIVVLIGCGGGSNGSGGSGSIQGATRGVVTLPPGFPLAASALHLATSHGSVPIAANGTFAIPNPGAGPSLLSLVDASNHLVMLGFVVIFCRIQALPRFRCTSQP